MAETKKISILGTEYDYEETTSKKDPGLIDKNGYFDGYSKNIVIETEYEENHPDSIKDIEPLKCEVKRHEIVHAFFHESGLIENSEDEQLVDWIACQFPKMLKVFQEVGAI